MSSTFAGDRAPPSDETSEAERPNASPAPTGPGPWLMVAVVIVLVASVVVRFVTRPGLWLDEALTVNIAGLPLSEIPDALRHDGAPPLYYFVLHGWMKVFGTGDVAVRALSAAFGLAAFPLIWVAGRRLGGSRVAWPALLLLASSPFAVDYSVETRMYSMVIFLVLAGYVAFRRVLEDPNRRWPLLTVAVCTGALLLTHYWSMWLLVVVVAMLVPHLRRHDIGVRRAVVAMAAGCLAFVPWIPAFVYQMRNTGAPWGKPGAVRSLFDTISHFAGGYWDPALPLALLYYGLMVLALFGRPIDGRRIELDLRGHGPGRHLAVVAAATLLLGVIATRASGSAFAVRYAAVIFPFVILLVALGTPVFLDRRIRRAVLILAVILGFWAVVPSVVGPRTSAPKVAAALRAQARPGDVVAYCPDQLGPSVSRLLPAGIDQVTFPRGTGPRFVDWVDYADVNRAARTEPFTEMLLDRAGPTSTIWVVWAPGYPTFSDKCQRMLTDLQEARPNGSRVVKIPRRIFERPGLARFPPS